VVEQGVGTRRTAGHLDGASIRKSATCGAARARRAGTAGARCDTTARTLCEGKLAGQDERDGKDNSFCLHLCFS
jgi:hypothetical protein